MTEETSQNRLHAHAALLGAISLFPAGPLQAQEGSLIQEITVTARKREESLQEVPDPITVFTSEAIANAGIQTVGDFMAMAPNLTLRDNSPFRSGDIKISMRGIGNGQQGWAPVTYVVDGVPADSLDVISGGMLVDIERIEVLRGPQSALYGAGAIAGAINVITQRPTNEPEYGVRLAYGKGNDKRISAKASGAIVEDKLLYRVNAVYRDSDGLIDSASNGINLDFEEQSQVQGRFIATPREDLELDFRVKYIDETNGSTYQDKLSDPALIETRNATTAARRRFPGTDERELLNMSLRIQWDLSWATLSSVTGYSDIDQRVYASVCWDDPDSPAVDKDPMAPGTQVGCLLGGAAGEPDAYGSAAAPGQVIDQIFDSLDNFETLTQDFRIVSPTEQRLRWLAGAQLLEREAFDGFDVILLTAPNVPVIGFPQWDKREDSWWGVYTQLSYDVLDDLEITFAGRYDDNEYKNTGYTNRNRGAVAPVFDENGALIDTQRQSASKFQPKVQLSYDWNDNLMTYASWSKGFRAGFFNTGGFTLPEETTNYEIGFKTTLPDAGLIFNVTGFHIDYSNQQFSTLLSVPPFRASVTIPETDIDGVEVESMWRATRSLTLSASAGWLDAVSRNGTRPPIAPEWTMNAQADFKYPLGNSRDLVIHGDYRYTSSIFLGQNEQSRLTPKEYVNLRFGLQDIHWDAAVFVNNLLDTREPAAEVFLSASGYIRSQNRPRTYGVEVGFKF